MIHGIEESRLSTPGRLADLFETAPVLVEIRFPGCGTSPDWELCDDESELEAVLARLAPGAELHLTSVWDLSGRQGALVLTKP